MKRKRILTALIVLALVFIWGNSLVSGELSGKISDNILLFMNAAAEKLAGQIAGNAPIAVRAAKKAINEGLDLPMDEAVVVEEKAFGSCFETADQQEGMGAFLEKRKHEPFINK